MVGVGWPECLEEDPHLEGTQTGWTWSIAGEAWMKQGQESQLRVGLSYRTNTKV